MPATIRLSIRFSICLADPPFPFILGVLLAFLGVLVGASSIGVTAEEPDRAPGFTLPLLTQPGETLSLEDYQGSYVLVDFWASWCAPCRESMPGYNRLRNEIQARFGEQAFEVLAINVDETAEEGLAFIREYPMDFPLLREDTGRTQIAYNIMGMPTAFLVNPEGMIEFYYPGYSEHHLEVLRKHLVERLEHAGGLERALAPPSSLDPPS